MSISDSTHPHHYAQRWLVLVVLCLGMFLVEMDNTIVNIALPSIQRDLRFSAANLQWVINAYLLLFGGFLLLGGRVADLFGRRRLFTAGLAAFGLGSIINAAAPSAIALVVGRGLQGLAAATLTPTSLSTLNMTFTDPAERSRALAVWTAIEVGGVAIGLVLGGVITSVLSWRWIFILNIIVAFVALVGTVALVPESRSDLATRRFDVTGSVTISGFLILLTFTLTNAQSWGWGAPRVLLLFAACVVLFGGFVVAELRSRAPLVRLGIFRVRGLAVGNLSFLLVTSGIFGMFYFSSLYAQEVLHYSPLRSGLALLPLTLGVILGAGGAQPLMRRFGVRLVAVIGIIIAAAGMLLLTRTTVAGDYAGSLLPGMVALALGLGLCTVPFTLLATTSVPKADAGLASGLYMAVSTIGGALGLAVLSTVAADRTASLLSGPPSTGMPDPLTALVAGYHSAYIAGAILFTVAILLILLLLRKRDLPRVVAPGGAS